MKNALVMGLRQGVNPRFLEGVTAVVAIIVMCLMETFVKLYRVSQVQPNGYHLTILLSAVSSDTVSSFVTIIAVLPYSGVYIDEVRSKFAYFSIVRSSYMTLILSRLFIGFLMGGVVISVGVFLAYLICALVFLPLECILQPESSQIPTFIEHCFLLFLNGGLWAVVGMAMSTLMESKYIAYSSPFVIYYLLVILYERYFPDCFLICPREWVNPSNLWPMGFWGPAILMIELTILFAVIFAFRAGRRLREL